ncbi:vitamin K epoxide reductase family protein [Candidatus Woesearchaeota archaeon]|nr:vitamin K epoxide reductase family protein [Candidatus Woesearchaeota archaeon]
MKKNLYRIIIIVALVGFIISIYLTYNHYADKNAICINNENIKTCDNVLTGSYSELIFKIPNSLIGAFGFLTLGIFSYLGIMEKKVKNKMITLSSIGLFFVLYLVYIILFVIKSFCMWCFISWVLILIIFICSLLLKV